MFGSLIRKIQNKVFSPRSVNLRHSQPIEQFFFETPAGNRASRRLAGQPTPVRVPMASLPIVNGVPGLTTTRQGAWRPQSPRFRPERSINHSNQGVCGPILTGLPIRFDGSSGSSFISVDGPPPLAGKSASPPLVVANALINHWIPHRHSPI